MVKHGYRNRGNNRRGSNNLRRNNNVATLSLQSGIQRYKPKRGVPPDVAPLPPARRTIRFDHPVSAGGQTVLASNLFHVANATNTYAMCTIQSYSIWASAPSGYLKVAPYNLVARTRALPLETKFTENNGGNKEQGSVAIGLRLQGDWSGPFGKDNEICQIASDAAKVVFVVNCYFQ